MMRYYGHIPASQKSYVCIHVFNNERPILLVNRSDGSWCFLCGGGHEQAASNYRVVGIGHLFERDSSLLSLLDLPAEWEAERKSVQDEWVRTPAQPTQ
jgi:hypothetical protein